MWDLITAILGKKYCGWCELKESTWLERFLGHDKFMGEPGSFASSHWRRFLTWLLYDVQSKIGIWKLGRKWHDTFHYKLTEKDLWINSLKVGDVVCNCSGKHVTIASFDHQKRDPRDEAIMEDGTMCSLFHCCGPVEEDNSCHSSDWEESPL